MPKPTIVTQIFVILSKTQTALFVIFIAAMIIGTAIEISAVGMMLPLMNTIIGEDMAGIIEIRNIIYNIFQCRTNNDFIFAMTIILVMIYIVNGIYKYFLLLFKSKYIWSIKKTLSIDLFTIILRMPYPYHLHNDTAKLQNILTTDTDRSITAISSAMNFTAEMFTGIGLLIFLFFVDSHMTFAMLFLFGCILLLNKFFLADKIRSTGITYTENVAAMLRCVQQSIGGMKFIYATRRQHHALRQYADHANTAGRCAERFSFFFGIPAILVENGSMAGICIIMAVLVLSSEQAKLLLPLAATFALAALRLLPVCNRVMAALNEIHYRRASIEAVYRLFAANRLAHNTVSIEANSAKTLSPASGCPTIYQQSLLTDGITLNDISFHFDESAEPLFRNLSLTIPANKTTAFIGPTGSGKTTLADIILGLHKPYEGAVLADGHDIFTEQDWWAGKVSYIPQNVYLCDDTILANVAYGFASEYIDADRVRASLESAALLEFVESLSNGIHTVIGENGIRLSGGQRQRVGIARALYSNPVFLVMDEATSALDNATEEAVMETITRLSGKITLLIIAHRLTTIAGSDVIYRIESGRAILEK